jgi:hypothetical protein
MDAHDTPTESFHNLAESRPAELGHRSQGSKSSAESPDPPDTILTQLADLSTLSLAALNGAQAGLLDDSVDLILEQLDHARFNLGGSGPPGRVD